MRVLNIEDKKSSTGEFLSGKMILDTVNSVDESREYIASFTYDIILINLSTGNKKICMDLLKNIKSADTRAGVIVICNGKTISCKVGVLSQGADDCLQRPFDNTELYARILALHRRNIPKVINIKGIEFDMISEQISYKGKKIFLSQKENNIIFYLLSKNNMIISNEQLLQALYLHPEEVNSSTIRVTINNIRKKLPLDVISTVKTRGHIIETV